MTIQVIISDQKEVLEKIIFPFFSTENLVTFCHEDIPRHRRTNLRIREMSNHLLVLYCCVLTPESPKIGHEGEK